MQVAEFYFCAKCTKLVTTNWTGFVKNAFVQVIQIFDWFFVQSAQSRGRRSTYHRAPLAIWAPLPLYHIWRDLSRGKIAQK